MAKAYHSGVTARPGALIMGVHSVDWNM